MLFRSGVRPVQASSRHRLPDVRPANSTGVRDCAFQSSQMSWRSVAYARELPARRIVGSTFCGGVTKMLGPAGLAISADRGIDRGLPGIAAIRTPPLIDHITAGQVSPVHRSPGEPAARIAALCSLRREPLAFVLGHSRGPAAFELPPKMHWIKENVQCARLLFAAGARERLSVTGACQVRTGDISHMVPRMAFTRARSRETAQ